MTLNSGDRIFFDVTPTGMTLQVVSRGNLGDDDKGVDTVVLEGCDVALFLHRLETDRAGGVVVSDPRLRVGTEYSEMGMVTVFLETDNNLVCLNRHERDMLVDAIRPRLWRLFQ